LEQNFSSFVNVAAILAAGMLIGMLVGFAFARTGQRRGSESDRIRERLEFDNLRGEYDEYRDKVEVHFKETSEAFKQTTEQYRALYQRIAAGAVELCDPEAVKPILATASDASNAVTEAANAAVTSFPRKSAANPDDRLGDALADMRTQMNELDLAIDELKADVIAPTRKDLEQRGVIERSEKTQDTSSNNASVNKETRPNKTPDETANRAGAATHLRAVETRSDSGTKRHEPEPKVRLNTSANGSSLAAVPIVKTHSVPAETHPQATNGQAPGEVPPKADDTAPTTADANASAKASAKATNGAVNELKNATRETKRRLFQAGRIISPGVVKTVPAAARLQVTPPVSPDRLASSPVVRLER